MSRFNIFFALFVSFVSVNNSLSYRSDGQQNYGNNGNSARKSVNDGIFLFPGPNSASSRYWNGQYLSTRRPQSAYSTSSPKKLTAATTRQSFNRLSGRNNPFPERHGWSNDRGQRNPSSTPTRKPNVATRHQNRNLKRLPSAINTFSFDLLKNLDYQNKNVFFSPLSIFMALSMLLNGAKGDTEREIKRALHLPDMRSDVIQRQMKQILDYFATQNQKNVTLEIANLILTQAGFPINENYKRNIIEKFNAYVGVENFASNKAVKRINDFVREKTHGNIKKLFETLDPNTVMVLLNALYFKGTWKKSFNEDDNIENYFNNFNGNRTKVTFMTANAEEFKYGEINNGANLIELPYSGNVSMFVMLPKPDSNLTELVEQLDYPKLRSSINELRETEIDSLWLPKMKIEFEEELGETLKKLGINRAFSSYAELSGINPQVYLSKAAHKAVITVNEAGSEAAAATSLGFSSRSALSEPTFIVNRPFFFMILDKIENIVLFSGVINKL